MLLKLFLTFFEIGAVSFGGGYGICLLYTSSFSLELYSLRAQFR